MSPQRTLKKPHTTKKPKPRKAVVAVAPKEHGVLSTVPSARWVSEKFVGAVGRRKTAYARVRIFPRGSKTFVVNGRELDAYFPLKTFADEAIAPLSTMHVEEKFGVQALVRGGGLHAQAQAVRHGLSRALVAFNPEFRKRLKRVGFLTRDARKVERKKPGLKKARRAPQWQKR